MLSFLYILHAHETARGSSDTLPVMYIEVNEKICTSLSRRHLPQQRLSPRSRASFAVIVVNSGREQRTIIRTFWTVYQNTFNRTVYQYLYKNYSNSLSNTERKESHVAMSDEKQPDATARASEPHVSVLGKEMETFYCTVGNEKQ